MGTPENQKEHGPSWADVRAHILEVRTTHDRPLEIKIAVVDFPRTSPYLYVSVVSYERDAAGRPFPSTAVGHQWPSGDWKSMPAMILALIWKLDDKLTDYERLREAQSEF